MTVYIFAGRKDVLEVQEWLLLNGIPPKCCEEYERICPSWREEKGSLYQLVGISDIHAKIDEEKAARRAEWDSIVDPFGGKPYEIHKIRKKLGLPPFVTIPEEAVGSSEIVIDEDCPLKLTDIPDGTSFGNGVSYLNIAGVDVIAIVIDPTRKADLEARKADLKAFLVTP